MVYKVADYHSISTDQYSMAVSNVQKNYATSTVLDMDNLLFYEEFLKFPVRADTDICADMLGFSARYRAEESRQEFCADSCGKWRKPLVSWSRLWSWVSFVTALKIYVSIEKVAWMRVTKCLTIG